MLKKEDYEPGLWTEEKNLTVEDLLHKFEEASGEEFANDRMMLTK